MINRMLSCKEFKILSFVLLSFYILIMYFLDNLSPNDTLALGLFKISTLVVFILIVTYYYCKKYK